MLECRYLSRARSLIAPVFFFLGARRVVDADRSGSAARAGTLTYIHTYVSKPNVYHDGRSRHRHRFADNSGLATETARFNIFEIASRPTARLCELLPYISLLLSLSRLARGRGRARDSVVYSRIGRIVGPVALRAASRRFLPRISIGQRRGRASKRETDAPGGTYKRKHSVFCIYGEIKVPRHPYRCHHIGSSKLSESSNGFSNGDFTVKFVHREFYECHGNYVRFCDREANSAEQQLICDQFFINRLIPRAGFHARFSHSTMYLGRYIACS